MGIARVISEEPGMEAGLGDGVVRRNSTPNLGTCPLPSQAAAVRVPGTDRAMSTHGQGGQKPQFWHEGQAWLCSIWFLPIIVEGVWSERGHAQWVKMANDMVRASPHASDWSSQVEHAGQQMRESLQMQQTHESGQNSYRTVLLGSMAKDWKSRQYWRMGSPEPTWANQEPGGSEQAGKSSD